MHSTFIFSHTQKDQKLDKQLLEPTLALMLLIERTIVMKELSELVLPVYCSVVLQSNHHDNLVLIFDLDFAPRLPSLEKSASEV
jgi:hypothetical protein